MTETLAVWMTKARKGMARVPRPPLVLAAVVAAAVAFVAAYLIGRATAPTHEDLRAPTALRLPRATLPLAVLGGASALPAAPKRAARAHIRARTPIGQNADGKLIVGTG